MTTENTINVTAWSNGGSGFGIKMSRADRDANFTQGEMTVTVHLPNGTTSKINIASDSSFWRKCHELRSPEIKAWFFEKGYDSWEKGNPPKFTLTEKTQNEFMLTE